MAAFRYTLVRRSIVEETFYIDANSEEEALQLALDECPDPENDPEWIDWYDNHFTSIEKEPLDPLYKMIKTHEDLANEEQKEVDFSVA